MGALGKYLRTLEGGCVAFMCPACKKMHGISITAPGDYNWTFNGNVEAPTFSPSIKVSGRSFTKASKIEYDKWVEGGCVHPRPHFESAEYCCHSFVVDGKVNYCNDCTHEMNGVQGVPLPKLEE